MSESARMAVLKAIENAKETVLKAIANAKESVITEGRNALLAPGIPTKNRAVVEAPSRLTTPSSSTAVWKVQNLAHKVSRDIHSPAPMHF